ncbi:MAG: PQQ-binding-like beta-propeller repeat protein [Candidatus Altiarchaeota archaeon]
MRIGVFLRVFPAFLLLSAMASSSQSAVEASWPAYKHDASRSGYTQAESAASFEDYTLLWSFPTGRSVKTTPLAADLDGDGLLEIVAASSDGVLYVIDSEGGLVWNRSFSGPIYSTPSVVDLDGDGLLEIVFGSDDGSLYAVTHNGTLLWSFTTHGMVRSSPLVYDLDVFKRPEVVFGSMDENVYCLSHEGVLRWSYSTGDPVESSPSVLDIDGDGSMEVVFGSDDNLLYAVKAPPSRVWSYLANDDVDLAPAVDSLGNIFFTSGNILYKLHYTEYADSSGISMSSLYPVWTYNGTKKASGAPVVGPVDNDSYSDIVFCAGNELIALDYWGRRLFRYSVSNNIRSTPAVADVDGDNVTDIVFGSNDGILFAVNHPGVKKWAYDLNNSISSSPALADLTGDGTLEIIVGDDEGNVHAFGSWRAMERQRILSMYDNALRLLDIGDLIKAYKYASEASNEFERIGDDRMAGKSRAILSNIQGYRLYFNASTRYREGDYAGAKVFLDEAITYFNTTRYDEGSEKAATLGYRIDADLYLMEAEHLYSSRDYLNASNYARSAMVYYLIVSDALGVEKAWRLANGSENAHRAFMVYGDAVRAFDNGSLAGSKRLLNASMLLYASINDSQGLGLVENTLAVVDATLVYQEAVVLFESGLYNESSVLAGSAGDVFIQHGLEGNASMASRLSDRALTALEAERHYLLGVESFEAGDNSLAANHSLTALRLFNDSGVLSGVGKSAALLGQSSAGSGITGSEGFFPTLLPAIIACMALFLAYAAYRVSKRGY